MVGQTLGSYRVLAKLGEGAMGVVYLAEHSLIGRRVALKLLHAQRSKDADAAQRFLNEARAVNAIRHPHIVDITDVGTTPTGEYYLAMELLEGETLADLLHRGRSARWAWTCRRMKCLLLTIALAIAAPTPVEAARRSASSEARKYFKTGAKHFVKKRYQAALAAFSAGYELTKKPAFLFNMGECARLLGDHDRAVEFYRQFLQRDQKSKRRAEAQRWIQTLAPPVVAATPPPEPEPPAGLLPPSEPELAPLPTVAAAPPVEAPALAAPMEVAVSVTPTPMESLSHQGQLGLAVRGELSARTQGGIPSVGATYGIAGAIEIGVAALIAEDFGIRPTAAWLFRPTGSLKPTVALGVPVFFADRARAGVHGGLGLTWDMSRHLGVLLGAAVEHFPSAPEPLNRTVLLLSAGLHARAL